MLSTLYLFYWGQHGREVYFYHISRAYQQYDLYATLLHSMENMPATATRRDSLERVGLPYFVQRHIGRCLRAAWPRLLIFILKLHTDIDSCYDVCRRT